MRGKELLQERNVSLYRWSMSSKTIEEKITSTIAQIVAKIRPQRIILFGSAARGDFNAESDLDILIIKSDVAERGIDRQLEVDRLIERNGIALDMLVYKPEEIELALKLGDPFIKEVFAKGRVLYG